MFISQPGELRPGERPPPERRKRPMAFYLRGIIRTPTWTFSDIAIDQPFWRGTGLLWLGLAITGLLLGAGGAFGQAAGAVGALIGMATVAVGGYAGLMAMALLLHVIAKAFDGHASIPEEMVPMTFAALPVWLMIPTALLSLLAGEAAAFVILIGLTATSIWTIRLAYIALREANRFLGTQAILTMMVPPLGVGLGAIGAFFVLAFGTLIFA